MQQRTLLSLIIATVLSMTLGYGQGTWQWSGRVHPELNWHTLETDHFNIHYHSGLDSIARQGAAIAEQARPTLMQQMGLDSLPRIDIIFTSEDEIMNGYALWTNMTFIWVDQNDVAVWLEDTKWLPQVLTHELQHIVYFNAIQSKWLPQPWHYLFSGIPGWFVEGLAEYETEKWRPYRADLSHKLHVLKNEMEKMDPHHDGYSKLLYLSDRFGDSTIVDIIQYRNKLGLHRFKKGFKKLTGISVEQFNEDWRRQMNTYYYGVRAQKEAIEDLGDVLSLPVNSMQSFALAADSNRIAIAGQTDEGQYDMSLFIGDRDSIETQKEHKASWIKNLFSGKQDSTGEEKKGPQFKWTLEEIDYGRFHSAMDWNQDGTRLAYAKYHFGQHQSMVWDIRVAEAQSKTTGWTSAGKDDRTNHIKWNTEWVTESARATYPVWSPDGGSLVYVAHHDNVSNLYQLNQEDNSSEPLTDYSQDTQILTPAWRPDGKAIAFAKAGPGGNLDLMLLDLSTNKIRRLTDHPAVDYLPVWHPDGRALTYTSHAGSTPNLYTVTFSDTVSRQITDVGDAVWSQQWTPGDSTILARTLGDVDSVRLVKVDPFRQPQTNGVNIRDRYLRWRTAGPEHPLPMFDLKEKFQVRQDEPYRFWRHPRHFLSLVFPNPDGSGLFGATLWTDAMGRHLLQVAGDFDWTENANSWILASYINAQHGPLWGLNVYYNANWKFRFYDQSASGLYEKLDGIQLFTLLPFNTGNAMTANHTIAGYLAVHDRTVFDILNTGDNGDVVRDSSDFLDLPVPESGQESLVTLRYRWLSRRPHKNLMVLPTQGKGIDLRMDVARQTLYGDFDYTRFTTDMFWNLGMGGPTSLFARVKTITMLGDPPAQEIVGFIRDPAIYFPSGLMDADVLAFPENLNPRGWDGVRLGDQTVFGTFEYRIPLIPELPVEVLGFSVGSLTGALLSDVGQVWQDGNALGDWITTFGYEVKFALQAGRSPLLYFAAGQAQTIDQWQQDAEPQTYLRMALINPF